jgi:hypothetical protein
VGKQIADGSSHLAVKERASVEDIERIYRERANDFFRFAYARLGDLRGRPCGRAFHFRV